MAMLHGYSFKPLQKMSREETEFCMKAVEHLDENMTKS